MSGCYLKAGDVIHHIKTFSNKSVHLPQYCWRVALSVMIMYFAVEWSRCTARGALAIKVQSLFTRGPRLLHAPTTFDRRIFIAPPLTPHTLHYTCVCEPRITNVFRIH